MGVSVKGILGSVAPVLASALPGPLGDLAKSALEAVLGKPVATSEEVEKILAQASPEMLLELKKADQAFAAQMKQLDIDLEKLATEDRSSARAMQVATKAKTPAVLAWVVVVGWVVLMMALFHGEIPTTSRDIVIQAVGTMGGALMMVIGFYFGSSSSSAKKDETIAKLSE